MLVGSESPESQRPTMKLQLSFLLSFAAGVTAAGTRLLAKKQVDSKDSKKAVVATFQPGNFSWGRYARE